ncbi:Cytochrome P450 [Penicillium expansum]|nr:Cytochrome P450 [Penicillium expansum]
MLEPFGPNVVSTDGDLWKFHLRVTVPPLQGDVVHRTVWTETLHRSEILATRWIGAAAGKAAPSLRDGVYDLTVNVMSVAGFEKQYHQQLETGKKEKEDSTYFPPLGHHRLSLVESLFRVVTNLPIFVLFPAWLVRFCAHTVYTAYSELNQYMDELLAQEKADIRARQGTNNTTRAKGNLLTAVVESNNQQPGLKTSGPVSGPGGRTQLTDVEVKGNVFMFLLAGYDTTANTILFSAIILSLNPPIQDAVISEIQQVHREAVAAGRSDLSYDEDLPKFRYLLAFMYEVMRVFPIVIPITRLAVTDQDLVVDGTKHTLPAQTLTIVNNTAIHHDEANWPHPHIIEPRRWLTTNPNTFDPTNNTTTTNTTSPDDPQQPAETTIHQPTVTSARPGTTHRRGTFMTFNEGPRACPGRRFAQVEFVAFFSQLLRDHRLGLVDESTTARENLEHQVRLLGGGSPVTLVPPVDVKVCLWAV